MNYDLAMMALEGLARGPLSVRGGGAEVVIEGSPASFKELARLCLLLGGASSDETFELQPGVHVNGARVKLVIA
jgi:hypothetical protein